MQTGTALSQKITGSTIARCESFSDFVEASNSRNCELSIWHRPARVGLARAFAQLRFEGFEDLRVEGDTDHVLDTMRHALEPLKWPGEVTGILLGDVAMVLAQVSRVRPLFQLRLEHVTDDACRRFHKDNTHLRLITTYTGPGTQWIQKTDGVQSPELNTLAPFDMAIFRGQRSGGHETVFHRSPPIKGSGLSRLVMVIDF